MFDPAAIGPKIDSAPLKIFEIRPCKLRDLAGISLLAQAYWKFEGVSGFQAAKYKKLLSKILRNPSLGKVWVAAEGNRLIGYLVMVFLISLEYGGISSEIDELYVDRRNRGRGVGLALLKAAISRQGCRGATAISLRVGKSNAAGIRFYRRLGFRRRAGFLVMDRKR